jgi:spore maturation protein CgeB
MSQRLRFRIFAHSWISDWNHGNAHFLRGLANELVNLGHEVCCYEESNAWSAASLQGEGSDAANHALALFRRSFPALDVRFYVNDDSFGAFAQKELKEADIVIVHEWNAPEVVAVILALKSRLGFLALFHDTHHRAYTAPQQMKGFPLTQFDGVLAFGQAIEQIYRQAFGIRHVWTFHEAADVIHFQPRTAEKDTDLVWVGNWGDDERTRELQEFLIEPASRLGNLKVAVHGVRYPAQARAHLAQAGVEYRGYLSNLDAPAAYARSVLSLHVPRRFYANGLSGIPTIRMFEVMACGSPLICSPWIDSEGLFRGGQDYISVQSGREMAGEIEHLLRDEKARDELAANGLETINRKHTCAHRAQQLLEICEEVSR